MRMLLSASLLVLSTISAKAETQLSFFGSAGSAMDSAVAISDPGGAGRLSFSGEWDMPGSAGMRVTWWRPSEYGFGVELNATSAEALPKTLRQSGIDQLQLDSGLSLVTVTAFRRWETLSSGIRPYVGAGVGLSVPQVLFDGGGNATATRQLTGPAVQLMAGASYALNEQLSLFGEVQGAYSVNAADLASGGSLESNLLTNGVNFGVSLGF